MSTLSRKRRDEYRRLFDTLEIRPVRARDVDREADRAQALRGRYDQIGGPLGVPWCFIAALHMRETSFRLDRHLHNGDPLTARTVRIPAGHPRSGAPPFTFEESARDALRLKRLHQWHDWSLPGLLFKLEAYNGFGYRKRGVPSPYLWSFSHHYLRGKFVKDRVFDPAAVDRQCGAATLLRRLAERQEVRFADEPALDQGTTAVRYARSRPSAAADLERAEALQHWLNTFPGIYLKVDGWPGARTSNAFQAVTGRYLPGDPRGKA